MSFASRKPGQSMVRPERTSVNTLIAPAWLSRMTWPVTSCSPVDTRVQPNVPGMVSPKRTPYAQRIMKGWFIEICARLASRVDGALFSPE